MTTSTLPQAGHRFRLLDLVFRIDVAPALRGAVWDRLRHTVEAGPPTTLFCLWPQGSSVVVSQDGHRLGHAAAPELAVQSLLWHLARAARCAAAGVALHAASVEREGQVLLLPGRSGAGKSVLSTELARQGWRVLSDELSAIDPATRLVRGAPLPLNLKASAVDALPWLAAAGGLPYRGPHPSVGQGLLRWVVAPTHGPDAPTSIERVTARALSLVMLAVCGSSWDFGFDPLTRLASTTPGWVLRGRTVAEAVQAIEGAIGAVAPSAQVPLPATHST